MNPKLTRHSHAILHNCLQEYLEALTELAPDSVITEKSVEEAQTASQLETVQCRLEDERAKHNMKKEREGTLCSVGQFS